MKSLRSLTLSLALLAWMAPALPASEVLVDCQFSEFTNVGDLTASGQAIPLKQPTKLSANAPSTVELGTEALGELKPPYALLKVQPRDDKPEVPANTSVIWELPAGQEGLTTGKYQLSFTAAVVESAPAGGLLAVNFDNDGANVASVHPSHKPVRTLFRGDTITTPVRRAEAIPLNPGAVVEVVIQFDLDAKTWGVTANGSVLLEPRPFEEAFLTACSTPRIRGVEFGSLGGEGHSPSGSFALSKVKLEKLSD